MPTCCGGRINSFRQYANLCALASAIVAVSTRSHIPTHNSILLEKKPAEINASLRANFPDISRGSVGVIASVFFYTNVLPLVLSFILMYAGTTLLLRHHSKSLGRIIY
jgi:hypothetical protein